MKHPLLYLLLAYLLLGSLLSVVVPLNEAPDEGDHFLYVAYLLENGRLPIMHPSAAENATMEANQPPLFYLLNAAVLRLAGADLSAPDHLPLNACFSFEPTDIGRQTFYLHSTAEQWPYHSTSAAHHVARVLSVILGAGTVAITYWLGWLISGRRSVALGAAALVAFNPQFIFINASVNNDVLMGTLGALIVALCVWSAQRPSSGRFIGLGAAVGLGLLTKFALFAFWPLACLAAVWPFVANFQAVREGEFGRLFKLVLPHLFWVLLLPLLIAGWLYARNWQLYGDPLVWQVHLAAKGSEVLRTTPLGWADAAEFVSVHFRSFWGLFGWLNVQIPAWQYALYAALMAGSAVGWVHHGRLWANRWLVFPMLAALAIYASLVRYSFTINWSGYQGRLAFAAVAPLAVLMAMGWQRPSRPSTTTSPNSHSHAPALPPVLFLGALACWSAVGVIRPAYPAQAVYAHTAVTVPTCARFANGLWLDGYALPTPLVPDQPVPVQVWGYATAAGASPMQVRLLGHDGQPLAQATADLHWQAGQAISTTLMVPPPATAVVPQQIFVAVSMGDGTAASTVHGRDLGPEVVLAERGLASNQPVPPPAVVVDVVWDGRLRLLGYEVHTAGQQLTVRLVWQVVAPLPVAYTTFVHVLDNAGNLAAQVDSRPLDGRYPTYLWPVGATVAEEKIITLPTGLGDYTLVLGAYQLETGEVLGRWEERP